MMSKPIVGAATNKTNRLAAGGTKLTQRLLTAPSGESASSPEAVRIRVAQQLALFYAHRLVDQKDFARLNMTTSVEKQSNVVKWEVTCSGQSSNTFHLAPEITRIAEYRDLQNGILRLSSSFTMQDGGKVSVPGDIHANVLVAKTNPSGPVVRDDAPQALFFVGVVEEDLHLWLTSTEPPRMQEEADDPESGALLGDLIEAVGPKLLITEVNCNEIIHEEDEEP